MAKILLVEDDEYMSKMVLDALTHQNIVVDHARDGREGLGLLGVMEYDMLILDWELPHLSGIELCKKFRSDGGTTHVLMLTGKGQITDKETGFDAGADDYLTKPFHIRELVARVKSALRRASGVTDNLLRAGDVVLDPVAFSVSKGGVRVELVRKEFALLEFLLRHPNQAFSPEALIENVWGLETDVSSDAARITINRIKKKLDDKKEGAELIQNIYGVGYKLSTEKG